MESLGVKLRAAQGHAKRESAQWKAFLGQKGFQAPALPSDPAEGDDGVPGESVGRLELTGDMVADHYALWQAAARRTAEAMRDGKAGLAATMSKVARDQMLAHGNARQLAAQHALAVRDLVPVRELEFVLEAVQRMADLIQHLDREMADRCNPEHPEVAAAALRNWRAMRWDPAVEALEKEMSESA
jgi:hypothetical protein